MLRPAFTNRRQDLSAPAAPAFAIALIVAETFCLPSDCAKAWTPEALNTATFLFLLTVNLCDEIITL